MSQGVGKTADVYEKFTCVDVYLHVFTLKNFFTLFQAFFGVIYYFNDFSVM